MLDVQTGSSVNIPTCKNSRLLDLYVAESTNHDRATRRLNAIKDGDASNQVAIDLARLRSESGALAREAALDLGRLGCGDCKDAGECLGLEPKKED